MEATQAVKEAFAASGITQRQVSREFGVSPAAVSKSLKAGNGIGIDLLLRYLNRAGYHLYAVPESVSLEGLIHGAIAITSARGSDSSAEKSEC